MNPPAGSGALYTWGIADLAPQARERHDMSMSEDEHDDDDEYEWRKEGKCSEVGTCLFSTQMSGHPDQQGQQQHIKVVSICLFCGTAENLRTCTGLFSSCGNALCV
jgi:hypothetical protein